MLLYVCPFVEMTKFSRESKTTTTYSDSINKISAYALDIVNHFP